MKDEEIKKLNSLEIEANKIKTIDEFNWFCVEYAPYDLQYLKILIPKIIENLSNEIDIKNNLSEWEKVMAVLYTHTFYINDALNKLYKYYPYYPIECLFELMIYHGQYEEGRRGLYFPTWYEPINRIYIKYYTDRIDKKLFDKYLLFANSNKRYFTALLYKKKFDIPKNSIYSNIKNLLESRYNHDINGYGCILIEDIKKMNIDNFEESYIYHSDSAYALHDMKVQGDIGFMDDNGIVHAISTEMLKLAIFEVKNFWKNKKKICISSVESEISFHDFLIYEWGVVKYFELIYKYGDYQKYSEIYNDFFVILEQEAKDTNNRVAIKNLLKINKIFNKKIIEIYPDEVEETILLEGAKKQIVVNAYERNPKAREKCINKYGFSCFICGFNFQKNYGEIGKEFIHVHHLKPLSEIQEEYEVNPIEDLRPVCPNCHAMLHRKVPAYSIEEIQNILKGQKP